MSQIMTSVYINEQQLLRDVTNLHCNGQIELDPMFFKGNFYKCGVLKPLYKFDINPQVDGVAQSDACDLPIEDISIKTMILDPPFMFGNHGKQKEYYSSRTHGIFESFAKLEKTYKGILREAFRILKRGGILIFKCQDYTDNCTTLTHCHVFNWASETGFKPKDLAILHCRRNKIYNGSLSQRHLRKVHSYFYIFRK